MNLDRALERAGSVSTPRQAAELYNNIEYELALGEPTGDQEAAGEQALEQLRSRFPGVEAQAREVEKPPSLSPAGKRGERGEHASNDRQGTPRGGHQRQGTRSPSAGGNRSPRRPPAGPRGGSSSSGRSRSSSGPGIGDLAPGFDATDSALFLLRTVLLLGVGYFILANKRGPAAFSSILGSVTGAVRAFVAPVDPFGSNSTTPAAVTATPLTTAPTPAASVSKPGVVTVPSSPPAAAQAPNMFTDPFAGFPTITIPSPLIPGNLGAKVKQTQLGGTTP